MKYVKIMAIITFIFAIYTYSNNSKVEKKLNKVKGENLVKNNNNNSSDIEKIIQNIATADTLTNEKNKIPQKEKISIYAPKDTTYIVRYKNKSIEIDESQSLTITPDKLLLIDEISIIAYEKLKTIDYEQFYNLINKNSCNNKIYFKTALNHGAKSMNNYGSKGITSPESYFIPEEANDNNHDDESQNRNMAQENRTATETIEDDVYINEDIQNEAINIEESYYE